MNSDFDITVHRTLKELEALAADWEACYSESPTASPYGCFDWFYEYQLRRPQIGELRVCVVRRDGQVIAILPLIRWRSRRGYVQLVMHPFSSGMSQEAIISRQATGLPIVEWVLEHLLKHDRGFIDCRLSPLSAGSPLLVSTAINGVCPSFAIETNRQEASVVIELPDSWKAYCQTLSHSHRKTMNRRTNNLRRAGSLRFVRLGLEPVQDIRAVDELSEDALAVCRRSWQGNATWGTAISDDDMIDFFREVNRKMARRGMLDLSILYLNDRPISFNWGVVRGSCISQLKMGFDAGFQDYAPGVVHKALVIEDSILRGAKRIELGNVCKEHKTRWSKHTDEQVEVRYYPRRPIPILVRRLKKYLSQIRGRNDTLGTGEKHPS